MSTEIQIQNQSVFSGVTAFAEAQRMAQLLASANQGVPLAYQNNIPNCVVAIELAQRLNVSPLMVMQNIDIIHNKPAPKSVFIISLINSCGKFTDDLEYEYSGVPGTDGHSCYAYATRKNGKVVKGPVVSVAMAKSQGWWAKNGSKWPDMTETMLGYRAAAFFSRLHCPGVTMGMQSQDEIEDIGYVESVNDASVIEKINSEVEQQFTDFETLEVSPEVNSMEVNQEETVTGSILEPPVVVPPPPTVSERIEDDDF